MLLDKKSILLFICLLVCWGSYAAVSRMLLSHLDFYQVSFFTFLIALLILSIIYLIARPVEHEPKTYTNYFLVFLAGFFCFLYYMCYNRAIAEIGATHASILNYTFPLWMIILAAVRNRKLPKLLSIVSVCVGFIGVYIALTAGTGRTGLHLGQARGIALALSAALLWGMFSTIGANLMGNPLRLCLIYTSICFLLSCLALILFSRPMIPDWPTGLGLVWIGTFAVAIPYWLWFWLIKRNGSDKLAALSYLVPFSTLIFISILLHEKIETGQMIGLVIIIAACLLQVLKPTGKEMAYKHS